MERKKENLFQWDACDPVASPPGELVSVMNSSNLDLLGHSLFLSHVSKTNLKLATQQGCLCASDPPALLPKGVCVPPRPIYAMLRVGPETACMLGKPLYPETPQPRFSSI